jgi:hypothetical protein
MLNSVNLDSVTGLDTGFDPARLTAAAAFRWNTPAAATGLAGWPVADSAVLPPAYVPPGRTLADYLGGNDALGANLAGVGVIVPADEIEAARLRTLLQGTTQP